MADVIGLCWRVLTFVVILAAAYSTTHNASTSGDFYELVTSDVFVDKTPMIEEYLRNPSVMFLIIRPSKWGKTTNMNMLKRFLEIEIDDRGRPLPLSDRLNLKLFVGGPVPDPRYKDGREKRLKPLKISESAVIVEKQGQYPVVYLSLRHVRGDSSEEIEAGIREQIKHVLQGHDYLRRYIDHADDTLKASDKKKLTNYFDGLYDLNHLQDFLRFFTTVLYVHYQTRVHVLIDDYDAPIYKLFANILRRYRIQYRHLSEHLIYDKTIKSDEFVQAHRMIGAMFPLLKHNYAMDKTLISGTFLLNDLLCGVQDTPVYSLLDRQFSRWYGFTSDEVNALLAEKLLTGKSDDPVSRWYGGYNAYGDNVLYNPCSISNYVAQNGTLNYYWHDADSTLLLVEHLWSQDNYTKTQVEQLMAGKCIDKYICKGIAYDQIRFDGLIHTLLFSGYLTTARNTSLEFDYQYLHLCQLIIPNEEVKHIYEDRIFTSATQKSLLTSL